MKRQPCREYRWFVYPEPRNIFTNNLIAEELAQKPENFHPEVLCADGKIRDLCEVDLRLLEKLRNARKDFKRLIFNIFSQRGGGKPRQVDFLYDGSRLNSHRRKSYKKK